MGGGDAAGEVVEIGADVTGVKPGDRVMGRCSGRFAEYALLDSREVMPAPERLSWEEAGVRPDRLPRGSRRALFVSGQLRAGETMLVTAAPSGVGVATLQLAKYLGANVIGTETLPYIPAGQWSPVTAYRKNLKGVIIAPALFMWNVE